MKLSAGFLLGIVILGILAINIGSALLGHPIFLLGSAVSTVGGLLLFAGYHVPTTLWGRIAVLAGLVLGFALPIQLLIYMISQL